MPWNSDLSTAIKNEQGDVALCYFQTTNPLLIVNGHPYKFVTKFNICLAWVAIQDAPAMLALRKTCCGGSKNPSVRVANAHDVRMWTYGIR